ncbi:MAG: two-component response regulator [Candidatus Scalindua rubra]|uniref:Two-component response regulator n=1 Tax=Candidatus Scalindua rubra TaxID=1872076 RepID=A0A1E3XCV3_9BACT|nr:MAG: two-component response regulator [Candidatus Scalindua rubra]
MSKILVVDDEVKAYELIKRFLETRGYNVITSTSGEDAIEKVKNEKPDVILLDIRMPGMEGTEVLKRVREFDKDVGIIMVTAVKEEETGKEALKLGADEYITKPIDFDYLETSILVDITMRKN